MTESERILLKKAFEDAERLRAEQEPQHEFSKEFTEKMEKLLADFDKPRNRLFNTTLKRTAAAVFAAALLLTATFSVSAVRYGVKDFFTEVYENYIYVWFNGEKSPQSIREVYTLAYVPEGYELIEHEICENMSKTFWKKEHYALKFIQRTLSDYSTYLDNEHEYKTILIGESVVHCTHSDGTYGYIWRDDKYAFSLYSEIPLEEKEIVKIIENVIIKE